jgi:hypothetical protein
MEPNWRPKWRTLLEVARRDQAQQAHVAGYDHLQLVPLSVMEEVDRALTAAEEGAPLTQATPLDPTERRGRRR